MRLENKAFDPGTWLPGSRRSFVFKFLRAFSTGPDFGQPLANMGRVLDSPHASCDGQPDKHSTSLYYSNFPGVSPRRLSLEVVAGVRWCKVLFSWKLGAADFGRPVFCPRFDEREAVLCLSCVHA
jgi:hypothetical protein